MNWKLEASQRQLLRESCFESKTGVLDVTRIMYKCVNCGAQAVVGSWISVPLVRSSGGKVDSLTFELGKGRLSNKMAKPRSGRLMGKCSVRPGPCETDDFPFHRRTAKPDLHFIFNQAFDVKCL